MADISLRVSILGLFARRPRVTRRPPSRQNLKEITRYIVLGINFGVIWAAEFDILLDFSSAAGQGPPAARHHTIA